MRWRGRELVGGAHGDCHDLIGFPIYWYLLYQILIEDGLSFGNSIIYGSVEDYLLTMQETHTY